MAHCHDTVVRVSRVILFKSLMRFDRSRRTCTPDGAVPPLRAAMCCQIVIIFNDYPAVASSNGCVYGNKSESEASNRSVRFADCVRLLCVCVFFSRVAQR